LRARSSAARALSASKEATAGIFTSFEHWRAPGCS
jgi:hypothetical protein